MIPSGWRGLGPAAAQRLSSLSGFRIGSRLRPIRPGCAGFPRSLGLFAFACLGLVMADCRLRHRAGMLPDCGSLSKCRWGCWPRGRARGFYPCARFFLTAWHNIHLVTLHSRTIEKIEQYFRWFRRVRCHFSPSPGSLILSSSRVGLCRPPGCLGSPGFLSFCSRPLGLGVPLSVLVVVFLIAFSRSGALAFGLASRTRGARALVVRSPGSPGEGVELVP